MSFRFLAGAGPARAIAALEGRVRAAADLRLHLSGPGFRLWTTRDTPCLVRSDGRAALIGFLIDRQTGQRIYDAGDGLRPDRSFVERYWGAYALIEVEPDTELGALRDPSGTVPLFYRRSHALQLAASGPELMQVGMEEPWQPDLRFVRHWLTFPFLRTAKTGIEGVRELLPGTSIRARREPEPLWSPWDHVHAAALSFEERSQRLRQEILRSVPAIVPDEPGVVIQLSGGLDSSIVAAALGHAGRDFKAVTFATSGPDGDERDYARQVARHLGIELVELVEQEQALPELTLVPAPAFRPPQTALLQPYERLVADQLRQMNARWVVNGAGGDNVFASLNTAAPAVDALRLGGLRAAGTALADLALIHNTTQGYVLRLAWRKSRRIQVQPWHRETRFLRAEAVLSTTDPHPWLPPPPGIAPGKREHVMSLIGIQHFLGQTDGGATSLFPLLSQPLLELCLSIPTHLWITGGRDRAVARVAFEDLLPQAVLARRGKGRLESMFMRGYMKGRSQLEELLREGELLKSGIVDGEALSAYLREPGQPRDAGYTRILELAAAESWLRSVGG